MLMQTLQRNDALADENLESSVGSVADATATIDATKAPSIPLSEFLVDFGDGLMQAVSKQNPPVYDGTANANRDVAMDKHPFPRNGKRCRRR